MFKHWNCLFKFHFLWRLNSNVYIQVKNVKNSWKRAHPCKTFATLYFFLIISFHNIDHWRGLPFDIPLFCLFLGTEDRCYKTRPWYRISGHQTATCKPAVSSVTLQHRKGTHRHRGKCFTGRQEVSRCGTRGVFQGTCNTYGSAKHEQGSPLSL